jgi:hypothetical protein
MEKQYDFSLNSIQVYVSLNQANPLLVKRELIQNCFVALLFFIQKSIYKKNAIKIYLLYSLFYKIQ